MTEFAHPTGPADAAAAGGPDGPRVLEAEVELVPVGRLQLHPRNPRRGDVAAIKDSLARNGQYTPLTVNRRTMRVLRGNHTLRAVRELGWAEVAVYFVSVDEQAELRILLADNRTSDVAFYDTVELAALLEDLDRADGLAGTGYEQADLGVLLDELAGGIPVEEDDVPPLPVKPLTRPGELIVLGGHRLLCADARDSRSYERLLGRERPGLLVTPPYGVEYAGKTADQLKICNDHADGLEELLVAAFRSADAVLGPGAPLYIFHPAGPQMPIFLRAFSAAGWTLHQGLVWVKDSLVLGHSDYHFRHEPLLYGFKPGKGRLGRGGSGWYGNSKQATVLEVPRPRSAREHPAMKPPELVAIALRNSSPRGGLVLDPFAGSGSTMAACEQLGRRARMIDLDPRYCDVIIARYEQLTGKTAIRGTL